MVVAVNPGLVYTVDYKYTPRWPFGNDGGLQIVSAPAFEPILPGLLVQALPDGRCQVARDLTHIIGVSVYDPDRHDPDVAYAALEVVPILRKGAVWAAYGTLQEKFPVLLDRPRWDFVQGAFTADSTGLVLAQCSWMFPDMGVSVTDGPAALVEANF